MRRVMAFGSGVCLVMALGACGATTHSATGSSGNTGASAASSSTSASPAVTEAPTIPATTAPPAITSPPAVTSAPSACYIDPEGNCYRAGEYCPTALHSQTVQGSNGPIICTDNNGWRWENG